jgi:hypothetical protein
LCIFDWTAGQLFFWFGAGPHGAVLSRTHFHHFFVLLEMKKVMSSKNFCRLAIIGLLAIPSVLLAWPIPDTGQTDCYEGLNSNFDCEGIGEDGDYTINPPSYTKLDANGVDLDDDAESWLMVRDNVTGLIWEVKQNQEGVADYTNPQDADNIYKWYCPECPDNGGESGELGDGVNDFDTQRHFIDELNKGGGFGGFTDWRLPTREELRSIVDYSMPSTFSTISNIFFPHSLESRYWSSSSDASYTLAWSVNFEYRGRDLSADKSLGRYVRAVRGGSASSLGHLVINGNDTVTDAKTGLMWRRTTDELMPWYNALSHCEALATGGYDDWRLPTVKELTSIAPLDKHGPAIDTEYFPDTFSSNYWSSTTSVQRTNQAWGVDFEDGDRHTVWDLKYKHHDRYVRAVRGGQNQIPGNLVISTPRQASFWNINSTLPITWDTAGIPGNVKISISYEGGKPGTFKTIAESTPNDGVYDWNIPATPSHNSMLKIEPLSDPSKGTVQGLFTILYYLYATPSSFGLAEPAAPDETPASKTFRVRLTQNPGGEVDLEIASSNPGECAVSPQWITMDSGNWNTGVEITVIPEYDGVADGDQLTSLLASTPDSLGAFQANDFPLVQVVVKDSDTNTTVFSVSPAYGEAGQPLAVTMEGANFTGLTPVYILPEGGTATQISPVTFVNERALSFTIPAQAAGSYTLRAGAFDLESAVAFADSSAIAAQSRKKAIVAAGSGPFFDNGFWLATDKCSAHAYETLAFLGYDPADIQFLSAALEKDVTGNGENDVDADATLATLQAAIDNLTGPDTEELLLYLVGPGAEGQFQFGSDAEPEYLTAATLNSWLDALQGRISGRVVVIVDAPRSDGFLSALQPPAGKERIVVTATSADEPAWFLNDGEISFSYRFFTHLADNSELFSAFDKAKEDVSSLQTPQIDATGDGVPDLRRLRDGEGLAIGRGRNVEVSPPGISGFSATPSILEDGSFSSALSASGVQAPSGLSRIWCRLISPIQVLRNPVRPVLTAPAIKLFDLDSDGVYEGEYGQFYHGGQYRALAYAVDRAGATSFPKEATVTQNRGVPMEIEPGDVKPDGKIDLADAIRALQIAVGMEFESTPYDTDADADGDGKIGLADAIFVLQTVGKMRP